MGEGRYQLMHEIVCQCQVSSRAHWIKLPYICVYCCVIYYLCQPICIVMSTANSCPFIWCMKCLWLMTFGLSTSKKKSDCRVSQTRKIHILNAKQNARPWCDCFVQRIPGGMLAYSVMSIHKFLMILYNILNATHGDQTGTPFRKQNLRYLCSRISQDVFLPHHVWLVLCVHCTPLIHRPPMSACPAAN